jgi:hypothetical protein
MKKVAGTITADDGTEFVVIISGPDGSQPDRLTKEDVLGKDWRAGDRGMVVASQKEVCPVWHDVIPYKALTVICQPEQEPDVTYWLEYMHGARSVSKSEKLADGRLAIRSDYQCW